MRLFASLDPRDRRLLVITLTVTILVIVATVIFARDVNSDDDPVPSTYKTGKHGARAAYDLLQSDGYHLQRWEDSLGLLAQKVDANSVVIFADPQLSSATDFKDLQEILKRGARVLTTGLAGGVLVPGGAVLPAQRFDTACQLTPQGLDPLAASGQVSMTTQGSWQVGDPRYRVQYYCASTPVVVEYDQDAGHIVWWSSASPLENESITRSDNLSLFLNSLGPRDGHEFYWDESLHGDTRSQWFYARGPALNLLLFGLGCLALLIVFSFSRRSGPVRDLPGPARASQVEFLDALGALYGKAGAATTALNQAYDSFRRQMGDQCGRRGMQMNAAELAHALRARFPQVPRELDDDLAACESVLADDSLQPKRALALVQTLSRYRAMLNALARNGNLEGRS